MGLETPLALFGLLAAAIPFLVHRLRRTDPARRVFPTFALLREAEAARRRTRGLTDLLLLAARVALLTLAALALGAPFVLARVPFGDGQPAATAIVIDDSMSMARRQGRDTLHDRALARAHEVITALAAGSEVALVLAGRAPRVLAPRSDDLASAEQALRGLAVGTARGTDLRGAIALGLQELRASRHAARHLLVLSDFAPHPALATATLKLGGVQFVAEPLGDGSAGTNVAVSRATIAHGAKDALSVTVELRATGGVPTRVPVELGRGTAVLARGEAALHDGAGTVTLDVPAAPSGGDPSAEVRVVIDDDLDPDDVLGILLTPGAALRILAVNGDPRPASDDDELRYLTRALELVPESEGTVELQQSDVGSLPRYDLAEFDVVLLANMPAPDAALVARLDAFVRTGGGLVVAPGDHVEPRAYAAALGELLPARPSTVARSRDAHFAEITPSAFFPHGDAGLGQVTVHTHLVLEPGDDATTPLRLTDGAPALVSRQVGEGRVTLLATTLDSDWSDLPLRPGFLPLAWTLMRETAARGRATTTSADGSGADVSIGVPPGASRIEVVAPDGKHHSLTVPAGQPKVRFQGALLAGAYRVLAGGPTGPLRDARHAAFVIRAPPEESTLGPRDVRPTSQLARAGKGVAHTVRRSLAPMLFLACAALALVEAWLRSPRR